MLSLTNLTPHLTLPTPAHLLVSPSKRRFIIHLFQDVVLGFLLINVVLFAVQFNRLPLFSKVDGVNLSLSSVPAAAAKLSESHAKRKVAINLDGKQLSLNAANSGIAIDQAKIIRDLRRTSGWNRLPIVQVISNVSTSPLPSYTFNSEDLNRALEEVVPTRSKLPTDANLLVPKDMIGEVQIIPEVLGSKLDASIAADQIRRRVEGGNQFAVTITDQPVYPRILGANLTSKVAQANSLRERSVTLKSGAVTYTLAGNDLLSLLSVAPDEQGIPEVRVDRAKLVQFLSVAGKGFYQAPVAAQINLLDGVEVSRTGGTKGKQLDQEKVADALIQALETNTPSTEAILADVAIPLRYSRSYSNTSHGLLKLIENFAATHGGSYYIGVVELTDQNPRSAFYRADSAVIPASTFKAFLAFVALKKIDQGTLSYETQTSLGTVDYCIKRMITISVDNCAVAIADLIGWEEVDRVLHEYGFNSTSLNNQYGGNKTTTANDEMKLLVGLHNRELLTDEKTTYLLDFMKQQIYRSGIPAGSFGSVVADKVGILSGLYHDVGIVYSPSATYALVIMTNGGNFSTIKALAAEVYGFYN